MHPGYESKSIKQAVGHLIEECGEVQAALGKTIRWGLESTNPFLPEDQRITNRQWVLNEISDLKIAITKVEMYFNNKEETL